MTSEPQPSQVEPVGWGIVGTGVIAAHFAADIAHASNARLVAVMSRSPDNARAFASRFGGVAYESLREMLANDGMDAVYIATPNDTHCAFADAAIAAGKSVLVEKPLATTAAEASAIVAAAEARGVFVMEAMWTRFLPAWAHVRDQVRSGALGDIRQVSGDLAFQRPFDAASRFFDPAAGGGALRDLGVYGLSLCLDLFGKPDTLEGRWRAAPSGVDVSATIDLRFGGVSAHLTCGFDRDGDNILVIEGTHGALILQPPFNAARMVLATKGRTALQLATTKGGGIGPRLIRKLARTVSLPGLTRHAFSYRGHGLQFEIDAVGEALAQGRTTQPAMLPGDSIEALRIIEAVLNKPPA